MEKNTQVAFDTNEVPHQDASQNDSDDIEILDGLSQQELLKLNQQRKQQLIRFYNMNQNYQIGHWYDQLQKFTFKSNKIQLNAIQAYILYDLYYSDDKNKAIQSYDEQLSFYYKRFQTKIKNFINQSEDSFYQQKDNLKNQNKGVFMKLSTRSPKDTGYKYHEHEIEEISNQLITVLKQQNKEYFNENIILDKLNNNIINTIYRFFLDKSKEKFRIRTFEDFLMIFSSSQRIIIDISDFSFIKGQIFSLFKSKDYSRADEFFIDLWARQWLNFHWQEQIRCFYKNYHLTAASQYDQRCYFKELTTKNDQISNQLKKFFQQLLPSLKQLQLSDGVMDLVLRGIGKSENIQIQVRLIQINVFNTNSRASLFSWQKDLAVLQNQQQNKFQLRILSEPKQISKQELLKVMGMVQKGTAKVLAETMKKLGIQKAWEAYD